VCGSKCVIYKYICQGSQLLGECLSVLGLLCAVTGVLKKNYLAILHSLYSCLCVRSYNLRISCKLYFLAKELRKSLCYRCQGQLRLRLSLGLAQMGAKDNLSAVSDQLLDGRQRCNQTILVCDLAILQRYVKIASYQDALSFYVMSSTDFLFNISISPYLSWINNKRGPVHKDRTS